MGQNNSRRISHDLDRNPNTFRDSDLRQIIDDIDEEISGKGYSEVLRKGVFVSEIEIGNEPINNLLPNPNAKLRKGVFVSEIKIWSEPTNNPLPNPDAKLRTHEIFTRTGTFITSSIKNYYDESEILVATATTTYVRAVNNQIVSTNTVIERTV